MERKSVRLYSLAMRKPRESPWLDRTASSGVTEGRTRCSLHLGAHLLHTPLNLHPASIVRAYQPQAGTQRSGLFPQNKLSVLSSCSSEVQDALRGASPGGHPSASEGPGERWQHRHRGLYVQLLWKKANIFSFWRGAQSSAEESSTLTCQANSLYFYCLPTPASLDQKQGFLRDRKTGK